MHALILAGGLGTRLQSVVSDRPKALAEIAGRPFLEYSVAYLRGQGVTDVTLCVGHLAEQVRSYFRDGAGFGVAIRYSEERSLMGTGGAVLLAAQGLAHEDFLVLNGDSFFDIPLEPLVRHHRSNGALATLALASGIATGRYGAVEVDDRGLVRSFQEKPGDAAAPWINAGVYVLNREIMPLIAADRPVSLEREVFAPLAGSRLYGVPFDAYFADIGVPQDLQRLRDAPERLLTILSRSSASC